jgi:1-acyl-sn-glycerol-3-phosphate acyltransferase
MPTHTDQILRSVIEYAFRHSVVVFSEKFWNLSLVSGSVMPAGPCFIYGNHSNNYDAFMMNAFRKSGDSTAGVMTMEYLAGHPLAPLFRKLDIMGSRKHVPEPNLIRGIYRLLEQGRSIVIYPEGGRRWDGRPVPWITSTVKLFLRAGVPVYPIITHGSYVGWPRWARYPRPARIQLEVLPPLHLDRSVPFESALSRLQEPVNIDENYVSEEIRPVSAFRPAVGISKLLYRHPQTADLNSLFTPDGTRIESRTGGVKWTMQPDSLIRDELSGSVFSTAECYQEMKNGFYRDLDSGRSFEAEVQAEGTLSESESFDYRRARISFETDHIRISGREQIHLPLHRIRYAGTERSSKLFLTLDTGSVSLKFSFGGSALQWFDALQYRAPELRQ